ncbi:MAG: hypothetical protein JXR70_19140 [Spirochaetales bacterium]|nr:hypothetical protein [Spirochaetales bacterium]
MPTRIEIYLNVQNESQVPISGIQCVLSINDIKLDTKLTGTDGKCTLLTEIGHEDKYILPDEFYSQLKIAISDVDGADNGGNFTSQNYTPNDCRYDDITITLIEQ